MFGRFQFEAKFYSDFLCFFLDYLDTLDEAAIYKGFSRLGILLMPRLPRRNLNQRNNGSARRGVMTTP
jgi:nitrate reductase assembly molybdenum cofactor insertion protein NarJ